MEILLVNAAATLVMVGIIWTVQLVHYPLFAAVGADSFPAYESEHKRRITWALAVPWPLELVTSGWLVVSRPAGVPAALAWAGLVLVVATVLLTVALQVPLHSRLDEGFDTTAHRRLVLSNWLRTAAWLGHGAVVVAMLALA